MPSLDSRAGLLALSLVLGLSLYLGASAAGRWLRRFRLRRRFARARQGEVRAEHLLIARGYEILARQSSTTWSVRVDGESVDVELRADYLVARGGRTLVAEVKTGRLATSIDSAATRRQLLEYRCAFGADGVLLVDGERDLVREVVFVLPRTPTAGVLLPWLVALLAMTAVVYLLGR